MIIELEMNEMEMVNGGFDVKLFLGRCTLFSALTFVMAYPISTEAYKCYYSGSGDCKEFKEMAKNYIMGATALLVVFGIELSILILCPNRHPGPIQGWE